MVFGLDNPYHLSLHAADIRAERRPIMEVRTGQPTYRSRTGSHTGIISGLDLNTGSIEFKREGRDVMWEFLDQIAGYVSSFFNELWRWLFLLNSQEWILLLAATSACGFLCMRGYGSRHNY